MTTKTLPDSTTAAYYYSGSGVTLVNTGTQGRPGASGINFGFVVSGNNDTLINNGTVFAQRVGVYITGSGDSVTNAAGKFITATEAFQGGVNFYNFSGTVTNYGTISGYPGATNGNGGNAVEMRHGGLVTNFGTLLEGGALFRLAPGTLVNTGVILGNIAYGGVYMQAGGTVTNLAGGVISANGATESYQGAPPYGVFIHGGAGTVTNAGTINGNTGNAVLLATGVQNRVIVDPGAVFVGTVNGGTAVDATIELASSASAGTLAGLGTQIINFGTVAFDSGASWLVHTSTSASATVFTGFATLDTIDLAGFVAISDTFSANTLVLTNASNAHTTLHVAGTLTAGNFALGSDGAGGTDLVFSTAIPALVYGQTLDQAGIVATTETVTAGVMTLFTSGNTAVGTVSVGTTLATADFILRSDGSGGTNVILDTIFGTYTSGVTLLTNPTTIGSAAQVTNSTGSGNGIDGPAGTAWTVTNLGTVTETGLSGHGINLAAGGTIINTASGRISAALGVNVAGTGLITNQGTIIGTTSSGAYLITGSVSNAAGAAITGASGGVVVHNANATVINLGQIASTVVNATAVSLTNGGVVINGQGGAGTSTAAIQGAFGIRLTTVNAPNETGTLINFGTVIGTGSLTAGVVQLAGGAIYNGQSGATAALIQGVQYAVYDSAAGLVVNLGTIKATGTTAEGYGIQVGGGTIINLGATALIEGHAGINLRANGTLVNAGTIESSLGTAGVAAIFGTGTNRLIADPGAVFIGSVSANTAGTATVELASAASAGVLAGFGTSFTNFDSLVFDSGAQWTIAGNDSANGLGTLGISGFTIGDTIDLTGFAAVSRTFSSNTLVLGDGVGNFATLSIQGGFSTGDIAIASDGNGGTDITEQATLSYGDTVDEAGVVAASETVAAGVMTLFNGGGTAVGVISVGTSLASGDFILRPDGSGGTDIIVDTVFGTYTNRVTLLTNPTTIASNAIISGTASSNRGVYGRSGTIWTLTNEGLVSETGDGSYGISFASSGTITNIASGTIIGARGVYAGGALTLINAGSIAGAGFTGTTHGSGVYLGAGGSVSNQPGGTITGYYGVDAQSAAATVVNAGSIGGNTATAQRGIGVYLADGGAVTNQSGGTISGFYGVDVKHATATVVNAGYIYGDPNVYSGSAIGVYLVEGGSVTNQSGGIIAGYLAGVKASGGAATVVNLGIITGYNASEGGFNAQFGIDLADGGVIINGQSGGTRSSALIGAYREAIYSTSTNASTITNYGIIIGHPGGIAIEIATGTVTNGPSGATGALINGESNGILISGAGMVVNYGTVHGGGTRFDRPTYAVRLGGAGSIGNLGPNALIYGLVGVYAQSNDTVTNAGTIETTDIGSGAALVFGGGTNRLIVDPGATFYGIVSGGGPVTLSANSAVYTIGTANGAGNTTLELASAASAGTLAGFGTSIVNFDSLVFDDGAQWTISGNDSASGLGTLGISGFTFGDTIDLTGFAAINPTFASNSLVLGDGGGHYDTLAIQGTFATGNFRITNDGAGGVDITEQPDLLYGQTLDQAGIVVASETVAAGIMTLFNSGATAVGTINVGTSLASGDFILASDGAGGTDVILDTVFGTYASGVTLLTNPTTIASTANISAASGNALFGPGGSTGWTVNNYGVINGGTNANGIQLGGGGSGNTGSGIITNAAGGTIAGKYGMRLYNSSTFSIVNLEGGTIVATGTNADRAINLVEAAGTVTNAGLIIAQTSRPFDVGVELDGGGTVINTATGTIAGGWGILMAGSGTVVNAGTISGVYSNEFAVALSNGDRLIVDPGAVFVGAVNGGRIGGSSTLELASAASAGTLTATNFTHFSTIDFDAGAVWTLAGATTALSGAIVGFTFGDTIDLTGFVAVNQTFASNSLVLGDGGGGYDTLAIQGDFSTGNFRITNDGSGGTDITVQPYLSYGQTVDEAGIVVASETVAGGIMTLLDAGGTAVGTIDVGTTLVSGDFTLRSDGAGGTDVIVSTVFGTYTSGVTLLTNPTTIAGTVRISGTVSGTPGVYGPAGTAWTVTNEGTINDTGAGGGSYGIRLADSGTVTNAAGGTIYGYSGGIFITGAGATVVNLGQIGYARNGSAIVLNNGGSVINGQAGGTASQAAILGYSYGIRINNAAGTVVNYGTIDCLGSKGVSLVSGLFVNGPSGATGALVNAYVGVCITQSGTVVNYGAIANGGNGLADYGILMVGAGTVANLGSASLIKAVIGIQAHADATVTNAGSIISNYGMSGVAIQFAAGTNLLVADPGAVFVGSLSAAGTTTLELASAGSAGTLTGFGTEITNFTSLVFDPGSQWTVGGNDSDGGLGTLGIGGFTLGDTIDLTGFAAVSSTFASDTLVLTDGGGAHDTLHIQGSFVAGNFHLSSDGNGGTDIVFGAPPLLYGQTIDETGIVATSETVTAGTLTLYNGVSPVGSIAVGTTLDTSDFTLRPDGISGTDVILSTIFGTYTSGVTLLTNPTTIAGTASISGTVGGTSGVYGPAGTDWTVTNEGTINDTGIGGGSYGIRLADSGTVTNAASGTIYGYSGGIYVNGAGATVVNLGQIRFTQHGSAIVLNNGGTVVNGQAGGTASAASISGYFYGIRINNAAGTVTNYGTIDSPGGKGVSLVNGSFVNGPSGATGALVNAYVGVCITESGTVINYGTILYSGGGSGNYGILMVGAGSVGNVGLIRGEIGIEAHADAFIVNDGSIVATNGASGTAIQFNGGTNLLVATPNAVFIGSIAGAGTTTLELLGGASAGTLTGFGTEVTNFTSILFEPTAQWTIAGNDSDAGLGTLGISGFTLGDTIDLTGFTAVSSTFASDTLVLTNGAGAHDTLHIQGTFVAGNFHLSSDGHGGTDIVFGAPPLLYGQTIDEVGIVATSETVTAGTLTLYSGVSPVGSIVVGTTLDTSDFTLRPDGPTGTDVIVSTVFGTYASSVTLVTNPTTIASTASITGGVTSAIGVIGLSGTAWTLINQGLVSETGAGSEGISFTSAGTIINEAGGVVTGNAMGIRLNAGGSVSNQSGGTISGVQGIYVRVGAATVANSGSIGGNVTSGSGIAINAGGSITNLSGGTISGSYGINASSVAATVVNAGSIGDGTSLPTGAAIALKHGGLITNQAGGQIIAGLQGIYIGGAAGTIINAGSIGGGPATGNGIIFASAGAVTNQSGGVITGKYGVRAVSGTVAVTNAGSLGGNLSSGGGVNLAAGGSLTNQSGGTITGQKAVLVTGGTVTNAGSIGGNTSIATGVGVQLSSGGSFTNQSGGVVTGFAGVFSNAAATVVNTGSIGGNLVTGRGVSLTGSGSVTNQAGGVITGFDGILTTGSATVVNAGSIGGTTAVSFGAGVTNRLVIDPGAVFTGVVNGGNTIGAAFISTMELASGETAGTLTGLGTQFINFANTTIDEGANWSLSGTNTVVAGATLTNGGTLTDIGTLLNSGTITGDKLNLNGGLLNNQASGVLTATYVYGVASGGTDTVVNQGTITDNAHSAIYLAASGSVTNTAGGSIHGYGAAIKLSGTGAFVTNLGQIVGQSDAPSYGVYLRDGGVIINGQADTGTSTASIQGYYGLTFKTADVVNAQGLLINYGTVIGTGSNASGVQLSNAGTVFNGQSGAAAALIEGGRYGISAGQGLVINYATIIADGTASGAYGIGIQGTGGVANLGTASLIEGHGGVLIGTDGIVLNAGTIASNLGASGVAVSFTGGNARLIDEPGAVFIGSIDGGSGGTAVLELASASSAGVISGLGGAVTNFTSLVFDSGAQWTVAGNDSASGLGTLGISGFTAGDTIDLTGFVAISRTFASDTLVLTDSVNAHETLHIQGTFATHNFRLTSDGDGGTDVTFVTPPTIVAGGTVTFTGGGSAVTLDGSLAVTDPDSPTLAGGSVSFGTGFTAGDTLNFTTQNGIGGSFDAVTGTLTLSGSATVADYQAALDSITYSFSPSNGDPTAGSGDTSRVIDWLVNDGTVASDLGTSTLNMVHVRPTITAGGTVTYATGGTAAVLDSTVAVSDPDSAGLLTGGTVAVTAGTFDGDGDILSAITAGTSITLNYNAGTEILTLSGTDTLADYQQVLRSVAFHSTASDPTNDGDNPHRTISWMIGDGVSIAATGTSTLNITRLPPVISGSVAGQTTTDEATADPFTAVSVNDPNSGQTETVTIRLSNAANGTLSNLGGGTFNSGTYVVAGTTLAVTDAIEGLVFTPTAHQIAPGGTIATTFTISVSDTNGVSASDSTTTVIVTAVNDAPVITGAVAGQTVTDETALSPFSGVSIGDADFGQTETVTVTLSNHLNGVLSNLDGGSYDSSTGVYTVTGSDAAVTTAVDGLVFTPTAHQVAPGSSATTTFTIHAVDTAGGTSSDGSTTVGATAVNDAPVIAGAVGGQTVTDEATLSPFSGVSISDVDFGQTETVTVTLSNHLNGVLSNLSGGSYDSSTGVYTVTGSDAAVTTAVDGLVFTPTAHQVVPGGSVATTFTIHAADTAGGTSSDSTTNVTASAVNDAPAIAGVAAGQTVTDETTLSPFSGVSISDVDFGQTETVTVTLSNHLNGVLSNLGGGSYDSATGVYSVTGSDAAVTTAVDGLVFTPTAHQVAPGSSVTTTFTIHAVDTAEATSSDSTTTVGATAVNDPPVITLPTLNAGVPNETGDTPFAGVTVTDPDVGHVDMVTVTLSDAAGGTLSNLGGGSYDPTSGVYTVTGSPDTVTAALQGLVFTPAPPSNGFISTTGFTVFVTGSGGTASNSSISVTSAQQVLGLAGVPTGNDVISVSPDGSSFAAPTLGQTNQAVISDPSGGGSYTLPTGYQAAFLGGSADASLSDPFGGNALLVGNSGNDTLMSGAANDTILGGSGQSTIQFTSGASGGVAFGGTGNASFMDAGNADTLAGAAGTTAATISGSSGVFFSQAGTATVFASGGNSTLVGGSGQSTFQLSSGATNAVVFGATGSVAISDAGTGDTLAGAAGPTSVTTSGSNALFFGQAGDTSVLDSGLSNTVIGGSGPSTYQLTSEATDALVLGGSGGFSLVDAGIGSTIAGGSGTTTSTLAGANAIFFSQSGDATVVDTGGNNTLVGGSSQSSFRVGSGAAGALVLGGGGSVSIEDSGTGDTLAGAAGPTTVTMSGSNGLFFSQAGDASVLDTGLNNTVIGGSGQTAVTASGAGAHVFGGSGSLNFVGGTSGATILGGSGGASIAGGSGGTTLFGSNGGAIDYTGAAGSLFYVAGGGNETLDAAASTTNNQMFGGLDGRGQDLIVGGSGNDTMAAGSGNDTLAGGTSSHDLFVFFSVNGGGNDVVENFTANDTVLLAGYGSGAAANALSSATFGGGSTTIKLSDNTLITFRDISSITGLTGHLLSN